MTDISAIGPKELTTTGPEACYLSYSNIRKFISYLSHASHVLTITNGLRATVREQ